MAVTLNEAAADPQQIIDDLNRALAECRAERDEALEQQTATAEVLQVINSSPGDLAPVFEAMLEKAAHLCETAFGVFHAFDGDVFHQIALRGAPPALVDFYRQPLRPNPGSFAERIVRGATIVSSDDLREDE